jgi:hypothetical protein
MTGQYFVINRLLTCMPGAGDGLFTVRWELVPRESLIGGGMEFYIHLTREFETFSGPSIQYYRVTFLNLLVKLLS